MLKICKLISLAADQRHQVKNLDADKLLMIYGGDLKADSC
jgi:hypothetical protein